MKILARHLSSTNVSSPPVWAWPRKGLRFLRWGGGQQTADGWNWTSPVVSFGISFPFLVILHQGALPGWHFTRPKRGIVHSGWWFGTLFTFPYWESRLANIFQRVTRMSWTCLIMAMLVYSIDFSWFERISSWLGYRGHSGCHRSSWAASFQRPLFLTFLRKKIGVFSSINLGNLNVMTSKLCNNFAKMDIENL